MTYNKKDLVSMLQNYASEKLADSNRKRRFEGRQLEKFLPIVEELDFAQMQVRGTVNGNINLGDLAEQVAKLLLGYKGKYLKRGTAKGYDGIRNGEAYEIKSHLINPSSRLEAIRQTVFITENSLYEITAEEAEQLFEKGERLTKSLIKDCGLTPSIEW